MATHKDILLLKATELRDTKCFDSDKDLTRFEFVKRSLFIIAAMIAVHFLFMFKLSHRDIPTSLSWAVDILLGGGLLIWTLSSVIVKRILLDYKDQKFTVHYITVLTDNKRLEVPFHSLTFRFNKEPTRYQPKKWTLRVFNNRRKVFSIETNKDGFSQETLEDLVTHLQEITVA